MVPDMTDTPKNGDSEAPKSAFGDYMNNKEGLELDTPIGSTSQLPVIQEEEASGSRHMNFKPFAKAIKKISMSSSSSLLKGATLAKHTPRVTFG